MLQIKEMKKSYRFVLVMTIIVIVISIGSLLFLFQVGSSNDTVLYVSIYALFNIYMYVITYLYSPNLESLEELQMKQTRKEHD
mmetsp:Transcript_13014/g.9423  ORF Transcript_13014/g.9423 Transcript_13014/m.9423 type:complete len:83 (-) Transcript_13014:313-561(-)